MAEIKLSVSNEEAGKKFWFALLLLRDRSSSCWRRFATDSAEVAWSDSGEGLYLRYTDKQLPDYEVAANL